VSKTLRQRVEVSHSEKPEIGSAAAKESSGIEKRYDLFGDCNFNRTIEKNSKEATSAGTQQGEGREGLLGNGNQLRQRKPSEKQA